MTKEIIINSVISLEGGYVNDPNDSGGETNHGITKATAVSFGYFDEMKDLTKSQAFEIYDALFWELNKCDHILAISSKICYEVFEMSINLRFGASIEIMQRTLNSLNYCEQFYKDLEIDGINGSKTIACLKKCVSVRNQNIIIKIMNIFQGYYYLDLAEKRPKDKKYIYGWIQKRIKL